MGAASSVAAPAPAAQAPASAVLEAPAPADDEDWSWRRRELGRFDVSGVDVVGVGAHCVVRAASDAETGARVALKTYAGEGAAERLQREVAVLKRLAASDAWGGRVLASSGAEAPGADATTGRCLLVMTLLEETLDDVIRWRSRAPAPVGSVCRVLADVGDALAAAHALNLVHGDVKPANIARERFDAPWRLLDVDDALEASSAARPGHECFFTELYAAPEAAQAASTDSTLVVRPALDVWGLGVRAGAGSFCPSSLPRRAFPAAGSRGGRSRPRRRHDPIRAPFFRAPGRGGRSRPRRRRDPSPRNIHGSAAAATRPFGNIHIPGRGGAAMRPLGISASPAAATRPLGNIYVPGRGGAATPPPRNIHGSAAVAPRSPSGTAASTGERRYRRSSWRSASTRCERRSRRAARTSSRG